jgi:AmmeMemoRadiSam system protein B
MKLRKPSLPPGWYPSGAGEIKRFLSRFDRPGGALAAIAPHAGWYYSGSLAARAVSSLDRSAETVVIAGGHLPADYPALIAREDAAAVPLGIIEMDAEFRDILQEELCCETDSFRDNTVEVQLPMVKYFFPNARLVWLRFPPRLSSLDAGKLIARAAARLGRKTVLLGSTDLTHYGNNYGYVPQGRGRKALDWVRNVNDAAFIKAILEDRPEDALIHAAAMFSACSAGAALVCTGFAREMRAGSAGLLAYSTSADAGLEGGGDVPDSFVGYAAISWPGRLEGIS